MAYENKGREELEAILERFSGSYESKVGSHIDLADIKRRIHDKIEAKKAAVFESVFNTMTTSDLVTMSQIIDDVLNPKSVPVQENKPMQHPEIRAQGKSKHKGK